MSKYAWCEDRGSGRQFWSEIFRTLHPEIIVATKDNNSELRKAASAIEDDGNEYYILMDTFVDNADVLRELDGLKKKISGKNNVHMIDVRSFEFALLSFQPLIQWLFAEQDDLKEARKDLIRARELFVGMVLQSADMETKNEFEELLPASRSYNNEQIATHLLYQLTRNTGFETTKGKLGDCFVLGCCEWASRQSDDLCGLDAARLPAEEKHRQLVNLSILKSAFEKVGL